jgi:RES domain
LALVDLRDLRVRVALGLDERVSVGAEYAACQAWSAAIHAVDPRFDGICYRSRLSDAAVANVALFTERCLADLTVVEGGRLRELEDTVLEAATRYGLTVQVSFDRP